MIINGLPILTLEPELEAYYRQRVIGGPGAFVIAVKSYEEFAEAVRRKLVTEIAGEDSGFICVLARCAGFRRCRPRSSGACRSRPSPRSNP